MHIERCGCAGLPVEEPGARLADPDEPLDLKTRGVECHPLVSVQLRIRRAQHHAPWLGWGFAVEQHHQAQATLKRLVPHHGGIQMQMRFLWPRAEVLEPVQGLEVDLAIIFTPCPTALWVRTGVEKPAVSVAPQCGDRVQMEADDFINIPGVWRIL